MQAPLFTSSLVKAMFAAIRASCEFAYTGFCVWVLANADAVNTDVHPIWLFVGCTILSVLGGLGFHARTSEEPITWTVFVCYLLNMGVFGASISMIAYAYLIDGNSQHYLIAGGAGILGLGGLAVIAWADKWVKQRLEKQLNDQDK